MRPAASPSSSTTGQSETPAPREPDAMIVRAELLQKLKGHPEARLIVVQGPAGFGKTSLLRQYSDYRAAQGDAIAWVRMDPRSADPTEFLRLLCTALRGFDERRSHASARPGARSSASLEEFSRALARLRGRAVIVVDSFEHGASPGLETVFAQLVRLLPATVQLCIGTRALPAAKLSRMLVEEQTLAIDQEDLRFRASETADFLRDVPGLTAEQVADIHDRSDGWPAALQCFRLCMLRGRDYRSMAYSGKGITPELIDFLASDVFEDLSPRLQSLLLDLCVPERISVALVEHITGVPGGRALISEIENAGLFLTYADVDRTWYRFHNLFRHFLLARLRTETSAAEMQVRHARIARWYADHDWREDAIQHYIDAGQPEPAAQLLDAVIDGFVAEERLGLIERYADQLPLETILRFENIANAAIIAYGFRRAFEKANRLIERRELTPEVAADLRRFGERNLARLFVLAAQDRIDEMGVVALETASQLSEKAGSKFGVAFNARAMWLVANHRFDEARGLLLRARPLHDQDGHLFGQAYQEAIYSMVLSQQGRINDAMKGLMAALRRTEQGAASSVSAGSVIAAYLADACYEQNRIASAEALVHDYGQLAEQQGIADQLAVMLLTQARMAHLRGDDAEAEEILERLLYLGYRHSFPRLVSYARAEFVRQATLSGDLDKAERRLRELDPEHDKTLNESLVFHAGEMEARSITLARYLIYTGRHVNARALLQTQIREARQQRRRRREAKLTLLLSLSLNAEGKARLARRTFLEALELAKPQELIRTFLDERQPALRLIRDVRQSMHELPDLPAAAERDALVAHLDRLLREAGEIPPQAAPTSGSTLLTAEMAATLTEREKNLLRHVAGGLSNKDLANRLSVSTNTVKWHLRNIFEKLQITNRVQAIAIARHLGLID
jgi:LuxR family maltose regulon positive regulatory protein